VLEPPFFFAFFDLNQTSSKYIFSLWRKQFICLVGIKQNIPESILPQVFLQKLNFTMVVLSIYRYTCFSCCNYFECQSVDCWPRWVFLSCPGFTCCPCAVYTFATAAATLGEYYYLKSHYFNNISEFLCYMKILHLILSRSFPLPSLLPFFLFL